MASDRFQLCIKILNRYGALLALLLFAIGDSVSSIPTQEFDSMLAIVRARGYNLFSNAIATSDLEIDLLTAPTNASFTFFAPIDSSLFALAMTQSASSYTSTLRYHGVPHRLSMSDLRRLPSRATIPTLLPSQNILVTRRRRGSRPGAISVNGVNVVLPGLYNGRRIAVHGLAGILSPRSHIGSVYGFPPPRSRARRVFPPEIDRRSNANRTFSVPISNRVIGISPVAPKINPGTDANTTDILPINHTFLGPAAAPALVPLKSPENGKNFSPDNSISSPSEGIGLPPEISSPSIYPPENENAVSPTPLIGSITAGETPPWIESEDNLSGSTVENHESLDWITFDLGDGKPNHIDIEDSHPHVLKRMNF